MRLKIRARYVARKMKNKGVLIVVKRKGFSRELAS
jgi:hypothetical protein